MNAFRLIGGFKLRIFVFLVNGDFFACRLLLSIKTVEKTRWAAGVSFKCTRRNRIKSNDPESVLNSFFGGTDDPSENMHIKIAVGAECWVIKGGTDVLIKTQL